LWNDPSHAQGLNAKAQRREGAKSVLLLASLRLRVFALDSGLPMLNQLTIAELTDEYFEIAIIPKTWEVTNFSQLRPGDAVNLEVDVIAKYVERLLSLPKTTLE